MTTMVIITATMVTSIMVTLSPRLFQQPPPNPVPPPPVHPWGSSQYNLPKVQDDFNSRNHFSFLVHQQLLCQLHQNSQHDLFSLKTDKFQRKRNRLFCIFNLDSTCYRFPLRKNFPQGVVPQYIPADQLG